MNKRARYAVAIGGLLLLWAAVGFVLVYDRGVELGNPALTPAERQSHAEMLYAIAGAFLLFNAFATIARILRIKRDPDEAGTAGVSRR
jgi:hypothetical protein